MCEAVNSKSRLVHKLLGTEVTIQQSLLPLLLGVIYNYQANAKFLFVYDNSFPHWWLSATDHDSDNDAVVADDVGQQHLLLALAVDLGEVGVPLEVELQVAPQVLQICKPEHLNFIHCSENFDL